MTTGPRRRDMDRAVVVLLAATALAPSGCSRTFFRQAADRQVYSILDEKTQDPRWSAPRLDVQPDPRSRFFDPTDPDTPPLPPDDPAAHEYMNCVYGMRGSKRWQRFGQVGYLENPGWRSFLPADKGSSSGIRKLTLVNSVELSLIHSREYQTQLENLYLAALGLTYERYRFDVRPVGFLGVPGTELFYRNQPDGESHLTLGPTNLGVSKLFPTGAQLVTELANTTLWSFSGPNRSGTASSIAYTLVQPLLRNGRREIVLEDLTQAERRVLYAARDFARFRKQFFVATITGGQVAGLQRFLRGFEFLAGGGGAPSVGFFPLLLRMQQIRNSEANLRTLEYLTEEMRATGASPLDIARLESSLVENRGDLVREKRPFLDRVDQYKVQLGLPPDLEIGLDDSLLKPFQFADPAVTETENQLRELGRQIRKLPASVAPGQLSRLLASLNDSATQVSQAFDLLDRDIRRFDTVKSERLGQLDESGRQQLTTLMAGERAKQAEIRRGFDQTLRQLQSLRDQCQDQPWAARKQKEVIASLHDVHGGLSLAIRRLSVIQTIVRVELIPVEKVTVDAATAVPIALENRLDLMNRLAAVMDGRRQLEIAANAVEARLDLVAEGELRTPPVTSNNKPFDFRARESTFRVGGIFDTPLDLRVERNNYRAAQIAYQRARRAYMAATDQIKLDIRQELRTLGELSQNLIQRRRRVQFSARELDLAETQANPGQRGLSITTALRSLNRAQDELIEVWLDYETTRLNLSRDMGTMQIDDRGFWLDPFYRRMLEEDASEAHAAGASSGPDGGGALGPGGGGGGGGSESGGGG